MFINIFFIYFKYIFVKALYFLSGFIPRMNIVQSKKNGKVVYTFSCLFQKFLLSRMYTISFSILLVESNPKTIKCKGAAA